MSSSPTVAVPLAGLQPALLLLGRLLIAYLFVPAGWGKLTGFDGAVAYAAAAGMPLPGPGVALAIVLELGGGLLLLAGWQTRWVALALAGFSVVTALVFHPVWLDPGQATNFAKNLALAGGLLAFVTTGAGALSIDGRRRVA